MANWRAGGYRQTYAWRRTRHEVLERDGWACQLRLEGCYGKATAVHHTGNRAVTGDDPAWLLACCVKCNNVIGDPTTINPEVEKPAWLDDGPSTQT